MKCSYTAVRWWIDSGPEAGDTLKSRGVRDLLLSTSEQGALPSLPSEGYGARNRSAVLDRHGAALFVDRLKWTLNANLVRALSPYLPFDLGLPGRDFPYTDTTLHGAAATARYRDPRTGELWPQTLRQGLRGDATEADYESLAATLERRFEPELRAGRRRLRLDSVKSAPLLSYVAKIGDRRDWRVSVSYQRDLVIELNDCLQLEPTASVATLLREALALCFEHGVLRRRPGWPARSQLIEAYLWAGRLSEAELALDLSSGALGLSFAELSDAYLRPLVVNTRTRPFKLYERTTLYEQARRSRTTKATIYDRTSKDHVDLSRQRVRRSPRPAHAARAFRFELDVLRTPLARLASTVLDASMDGLSVSVLSVCQAAFAKVLRFLSRDRRLELLNGLRASTTPAALRPVRFNERTWSAQFFDLVSRTRTLGRLQPRPVEESPTPLHSLTRRFNARWPLEPDALSIPLSKELERCPTY